MKTKVILIILIIISQNLYSQTYIKDGQKVFGTWKKSNSPYIINGEAIIPTGKTLKIKKGVEIRFKTGTSRDYRVDGLKNREFDLGFLRVNGKIIAKGTDKDRITFTSDGYGNWGTIFINSREKGNYFKYCDFKYGYHIRSIITNDNSTGVLSFYNSTGTIDHCLFVNNGWTAINCKEKSSPIINNVTIVKNNYGIECNSGSKPIITNSILWKNNTALYINGSSMPKISYTLIQDNQLEREYDKGNNILGQDPEFKDEVFNEYNIAENSICKKAGEKGKDLGSE